MPIKVTLVGHSYVRRLMEYRVNSGENESRITADGVVFDLEYVHKGGCGYEFFNSSDQHKKQIVGSRPDIVL